MDALFDTSALIKIVLREPESEVAERAWETAARVFASQVAYPEARAALAAAVRGGRLGTLAAAQARDALEERWEESVAVDAGEMIALLAGDLAEEQALRGCDAVHLATALALADPDVVVVTWDPGLARAADRLGLATEPPA